MHTGHHSFLDWFSSNMDRCVFFFFFCVAVYTFQEYGMAWDEYQQHKIGSINYAYIFEGSKELLTFVDRDYGVAFELPLIFIEKAFNMEDPRSIYLMRHAVTHAFFLWGAWVFMRLIEWMYRSKALAVLGFLLLISHPRIYGHSFFNSKDIPFLAMLIIALYCCVRAFYGTKRWRYFLAGMCAGLLVNMRIVGVLLPVLLSGVLLIDALRVKTLGNAAKNIGVMVLSFGIVLYVTWPFLWLDPIDNFSAAFTNMSQFRWNRTVLFEGQHVLATQLHWSYLMKWVVLSTPIIVTVFCGLAIVWILGKFVRRPTRFISNPCAMVNGMFLAFATAPIVAVIVLDSIVYDGWRQLFFVYPLVLLVLIFALHTLKSARPGIFRIGVIPLLLAVVVSLIDGVRLFPYGQVYMNHWVSHGPPELLRETYELDYWGLSYRESLEWILDHDASDTIRIFPANAPGVHNINMLPEESRARIEVVMPEYADYFITNYRWDQEYDSLKHRQVHAVIVNHNTINGVFKLKE